MKYRFLHIPAVDSDSKEEELNRFCAGQRVAVVEKEFVADGKNSFWAVCVRAGSEINWSKLSRVLVYQQGT